MSSGEGVLKQAGPVLEVVRILDASRRAVWEAWTDPEALKQWWGPRGSTIPEFTVELRAGGPWRACIRSADGEEHWARGIYQDVAPPRRLEYTWIWENGDNHEMLASVGFEELGYKTRVTVFQSDFEELGYKTRVTVFQSDFETPEDCDEHREGWTQSLDRLGEYLRKR